MGNTLHSTLLLVVVTAAVLSGAACRTEPARPADDPNRPAGTRGIDTDRAREVGAEVGERTAAAADEARRALETGTVTAKIKAKMALDDMVRARDIDVDTVGTTVTLSGTVVTAAERDRALQLARDTEGVTQVHDKLHVTR
jgi:hypothetical protein